MLTNRCVWKMWNSSTCSRAYSNSQHSYTATPRCRAVELHIEPMKGVTVCRNLFSCGVIGRWSSGRSDVTVGAPPPPLSVGCGGIWTPLTANPCRPQLCFAVKPQQLLQGADRGRRERVPPSGLGQHLNPLVQLIISNLRASAGGKLQ